MTDHRSRFNGFTDRRDAGRQLAGLLRDQITGERPLVLALPRGGVPVASEIASALGAELDLLLVRKLGTPWSPELAAGAIATGDVTVYNEEVLESLGLDEQALESVRERERDELRRRERAYRGDRPAPRLEGRNVVLVDDGVATGATMEAAVEAVRKAGAREVTLAVPTAAGDALARLASRADRVTCIATPEPYVAVGAWYASFPQLSDEDVVTLLAEARSRIPLTADRRTRSS